MYGCPLQSTLDPVCAVLSKLTFSKNAFENTVIRTLSSTGSILSNTDLSDLSTVGTCDIFVYQMCHRVM